MNLPKLGTVLPNEKKTSKARVWWEETNGECFRVE
jgi:hypothetical protein